MPTVTPKHKVSVPDKDPRWADSDTLGNKLERALLRFVQSAITWSIDPIIDLLEKAIDRGFRILAPGMLRVFDPVFKMVETDPFMPQEYKQLIANVRKEEGEFQVVAGTIALAPIVLGLLLGIGAPALRLAEHKTDQVARSNLASVGDLLAMVRREAMHPDIAGKFATLAGTPNEIYEGYKAITLNLLTVGDGISAWLRGEYSDTAFEKFLVAAGYKADDIPVIKKLAYQLPGVTDLIRMMVRDAFNPSVVEQYSYDEEYPAQATALGKQIGLAEEWMRRYWWSHWELPSPSQGFEMLQRRVISPDELGTLLKISDYPKFWRDKLIAISYSTFTRVDIRRMYQAKVLGETEVYEAYRDIGYDDFHAKKLTEFTVLQVTEDEKDLTRGDIVGAFDDDIYSETETQAALSRIGLDAAESALLLARAKKAKAEKAQNETIANTQAAFTNRLMEEAQAVSTLAGAGITDGKIKRLIANWKVTRDSRIEKPSRSEAERFYVGAVITESEYKDYLKDLGYSDKYIAWYVSVAQAQGAAVEAKVLSQSDILSSFVADAMTEQDARARLAALGLSADEIDVLIEREKANRASKVQREVERLTRLQYINTLVTVEQARSALSAAGVEIAEQDALLADWGRTRAVRLAQQQADSERELGKSEALVLFKRGELSEADTIASIRTAGYSDNATTVLIAGAKADIAERRTKDAIDLARVQFLNEQIDETEALAALTGAGLRPDEIAAKLAEWQRAKEVRTQRLTQAQAERLALAGVISEEFYASYLALLEYPSNEVELLMAAFRQKQAGA